MVAEGRTLGLYFALQSHRTISLCDTAKAHKPFRPRWASRPYSRIYFSRRKNRIPGTTSASPPPHNARSVTHEALLKPWLSLGLGRTHSGWNRASAPVCLPLFLSGLIRSTSTSGPVHQRSHCVTTQQVFGHPENRDKFSAVDTSAL